MLKFCSGIFSPIIAKLAKIVSRESLLGRFQGSSDQDKSTNCRLILNLNTISKLLVKLYLSREKPHIVLQRDTNRDQFAYRPKHSTETALVIIVSDDLVHIDTSRTTCLTWSWTMTSCTSTSRARPAWHSTTYRQRLSPSTTTLLTRLSMTFGVRSTSVVWLKSYLSGRHSYVKVGISQSANVPTSFGVSRGSVLGPYLFSLYIIQIMNIVRALGVSYVNTLTTLCR